MSQVFANLQDDFRNLKEKHNLDLTHPNGVVLDNKMYPAVNKTVSYHDVDTNPLDWLEKSEFIYKYASFEIPYENGNRLKVVVNNDRLLPRATFSALIIPTTIIDGEGNKEYTYGGLQEWDERHQAMTARNVDKQIIHHLEGKPTIHETIQGASKMETKGQYHWFGSGSYDQYKKIRQVTKIAATWEDKWLNPEELNEHRQNYKLAEHSNPNFIKSISTYNSDANATDVLSRPMQEENRAWKRNPEALKYLYNIKTEQLHKIEGD